MFNVSGQETRSHGLLNLAWASGLNELASIIFVQCVDSG